MHVVSESVLLSTFAEEIGQKVGRRTISQLHAYMSECSLAMIRSLQTSAPLDTL